MTGAVLALWLLSSPVRAADVTVGSYGRAQVASELDGGSGQSLDVVAFGSRLYKASYAEVDLGWKATDEESGTSFRALLTPALAGTLFHYDGTFDASLAVRNLYAEARPAGGDAFVWAGSRMLRGDDVYLLDFWPLDNLNTVGGGGGWRDDRTEVAAHVGLNRLDGGDWQFQSLDVPLVGGVGTESVVVLDRQRVVGSLRAGRAFDVSDTLTLRSRAYGEAHGLPAGARRVEDGTVDQALPAETGWLGGAELSAYGWAPDSYVHLFWRHATGIGATGELVVPNDGLALDRSVRAAWEDRVALAGNHEAGPWGVAVGGYWRAWADADRETADLDDGWEANVAVRPAVYPTRWLSVAAEASHQRAARDGVNTRTGQRERAAISRVSLLPAIQLRPGTFGRPQVRLQYTATFLDDAARAWFDPSDTRAAAPVHHAIGIGAEWWINSQSYR